MSAADGVPEQSGASFRERVAQKTRVLHGRKEGRKEGSERRKTKKRRNLE
jgi:hypothetical protein